MRIGFSVPQFGPFAEPHRSAAPCSDLEAIGCHSLWVADRLLSPLVAPVGYAGGRMPVRYGTHLDPLLALGMAAMATERVRLGSSTLNRRLLPLTALLGAVYLVLVDLLSRTVIRPNELPLGILTALLGAPFFLWLLRRNKTMDTA